MATLYLDVETNGEMPDRGALIPAFPRLVQVAFQVVRGGETAQTYCEYVQLPADHAWSDGAFRVNGITREQAMGGKPPREVLDALAAAVRAHGVAAIVGHNVLRFDAPALEAEASRHDIRPSGLWGSARMVCTMTHPAAMRFYQQRRWCKLTAAYAKAHGGVEWAGGAHRADQDVQCVRKLHERLVELGVLAPTPAPVPVAALAPKPTPTTATPAAAAGGAGGAEAPADEESLVGKKRSREDREETGSGKKFRGDGSEGGARDA